MAIIYDDDIAKALSLAAILEAPRDIRSAMLKAAAEPLVKAQTQMALAAGFSDTGTTARSSHAENPVILSDGGFVQVGFQGVRNRRTPTRNAEIAFFNNYGVKNRNRETRFVDRAVDKAAGETVEAAATVFFAWQDKQLG